MRNCFIGAVNDSGKSKYTIYYTVDGKFSKMQVNSAKEKNAILKAFKSGRWREDYQVLKVVKSKM